MMPSETLWHTKHLQIRRAALAHVPTNRRALGFNDANGIYEYARTNRIIADVGNTRDGWLSIPIANGLAMCA
jgi:hypothetical protein